LLSEDRVHLFAGCAALWRSVIRNFLEELVGSPLLLELRHSLEMLKLYAFAVK